ncbi:rhodanese-like domain-containing protein [Algoriphagus namhaensis]
MKKVLTSFLLIFALISGISSVEAQEMDSVKTISIRKFAKMAKKPKNVVLDVRTPEETVEGHITDAVFADFFAEDFLTQLEPLDKEKTHLVYCRSGVRAKKATAQMKQAGFRKVFVLEGGLKAWENEGKPIEK